MKVAKDTKGNVFEELGFDASESADLALRAYLMSEIRKFIKANELTQMRAARFLVCHSQKSATSITERLRKSHRTT